VSGVDLEPLDSPRKALDRRKIQTCAPPATTPRRAVSVMADHDYAQRPSVLVVNWEQKKQARDVRDSLETMPVSELRRELQQRQRDASGAKAALRERLSVALAAELQCEVELQPGEWHRADIKAIEEEDVTVRVKQRQRGTMHLEMHSAR
jgi:hypothetical protein